MYYALSKLIGYAIKKINAGIKNLMHANHYKQERGEQLYDAGYPKSGDLRVAYEDLETKGFDAGGGEILYYQGHPFTGTIVEYREGVLVGEEEFRGGHIGGAQRSYHKNGQIMSEDFVAFNKPYGLCREWDENGRLTFEHDFGPEPKIGGRH